MSRDEDRSLADRVIDWILAPFVWLATALMGLGMLLMWGVGLAGLGFVVYLFGSVVFGGAGCVGGVC